MDFIMERIGTKVTTEGMTASIPNNVSMLSVFAENPFTPKGDYREDGWVYVDDKPIKKWFKNIERISVWFPILEDLHKLQDRYLAVNQKYKEYLKKEYRYAFNQLKKVGKAHTKITHKYTGSDDPWWFYTSKKYPGQQGISWDWVKTPKKPINKKIGDAYYKAEHRLSQWGGRVHKFRTILEYAIRSRVIDIEGKQGLILQFKIGDRIYWFQKFEYWEKLAFPEDDIKVVEV